ncbi:MAG: inner-membrane translocator, branched-chain amino acid transport system permease protein [Candidatus Rokubacteria bacterium CSP1-6]|jgi:branched-chain amino acid transport system permease protein|nr:MAG: inner-membrane translocator, branched-chain amino acid transport system permease protein [Candidatus Rokubacteria bacterium CSP1-6]
MTVAVVILLDGVLYAAVLFLVAAGLTLVYGVMRILNIAHGSLYALGAYAGTSLVLVYLKTGGPAPLMYLALLAGAVVAGAIAGPLVERLLLRPIYGREEVVQLLVTYSLFLILEDVMKLLWGVDPYYVAKPYAFLGTVTIAGVRYAWYQLLLIAVALATGVLVSLAIRGTRLGRMIVAVTADREISATLGINVGRVYTLAFTAGAILAGLGGALVAPLISVAPGISVEAIVLAFAVVVIGGLGSLEGAALGALIVGITRAAAVQLFPEIELATVYLIMVAVLLFRPRGLFGEWETRRI